MDLDLFHLYVSCSVHMTSSCHMFLPCWFCFLISELILIPSDVSWSYYYLSSTFFPLLFILSYWFALAFRFNVFWNSIIYPTLYSDSCTGKCYVNYSFLSSSGGTLLLINHFSDASSFVWVLLALRSSFIAFLMWAGTYGSFLLLFFLYCFLPYPGT